MAEQSAFKSKWKFMVEISEMVHEKTLSTKEYLLTTLLES